MTADEIHVPVIDLLLNFRQSRVVKPGQIRVGHSIQLGEAFAPNDSDRGEFDGLAL